MSLVVCSPKSVCWYTISSSLGGKGFWSSLILSGAAQATGRLWSLRACSALLLLYVQSDSITSWQLQLGENSPWTHRGRFGIQFLDVLKRHESTKNMWTLILVCQHPQDALHCFFVFQDEEYHFGIFRMKYQTTSCVCVGAADVCQ